jgi:hypothetical protein
MQVSESEMTFSFSSWNSIFPTHHFSPSKMVKNGGGNFQSRMRSICLGCFVMMSAKEMQCTYCFKNVSDKKHLPRHLRTCKVKNNELTLLTDENTKLREENKKYVRLEAKHQALIKLIKKHPPPRPAMAQNRRLRIAAGQNWECAICHMKLSSVFHIDHIQRWTDTFDDTDENLQCLCVECHTQKTSEENGA